MTFALGQRNTAVLPIYWCFMSNRATAVKPPTLLMGAGLQLVHPMPTSLLKRTVPDSSVTGAELGNEPRKSSEYMVKAWPISRRLLAQMARRRFSRSDCRVGKRVIANNEPTATATSSSVSVNASRRFTGSRSYRNGGCGARAGRQPVTPHARPRKGNWRRCCYYGASG